MDVVVPEHSVADNAVSTVVGCVDYPRSQSVPRQKFTSPQHCFERNSIRTADASDRDDARTDRSAY